MIQRFYVQDFVALLAAIGYFGSFCLMLFWVFVSMAEISGKGKNVTSSLLLSLSLFGFGIALFIHGWYVAIEGVVPPRQIVVVQGFLSLGMLFGTVFTIVFLLHRTKGVNKKDEGVTIFTGRPEPVLNTAVIISLVTVFFLLSKSLGAPITEDLVNVVSKYAAAIGPLIAAWVARRWVTAVSDPEDNYGRKLVPSEKKSRSENSHDMVRDLKDISDLRSAKEDLRLAREELHSSREELDDRQSSSERDTPRG